LLGICYLTHLKQYQIVIVKFTELNKICIK
jgi:hypothetical protein